MLLEKSAGLTQHPQAHYINNRTMEASACQSQICVYITHKNMCSWLCNRVAVNGVCHMPACQQTVRGASIPSLRVDHQSSLEAHNGIQQLSVFSFSAWSWCLQVFRGVPGLAQQVSELSPPLSEWRRFIYCESMISGQLLGEVDHFPGAPGTCCC